MLQFNPHPDLVLKQHQLKVQQKQRDVEQRNLREQAQKYPGLRQRMLLVAGDGLVALGHTLQRRGQPAGWHRPVEPA